MNSCTPHARQNTPPEIVAYTGPDRLSVLPDDLLTKILSSLKPKEVTQTCILSKRWEKLWSFVPSLCFDMADFLDKDIKKVTKSILEKFEKFVTSFLLCRDEASNIHTFRLLCGRNFNSDETAVSVRKWVLYGLKHNPKILHVSFYGDYSLNLSDCLFTCQSLEDVNLYFNKMYNEDMRPKTVCLPRLRNLNLTCVRFSDDYLETFLSGCPALESLSIEFCQMYNFSSHTVKRLRLSTYTIDSVTISAPGVEILDFNLEMEAMIILKDASKVTRATFSSRIVAGAYRCNLLNSLSSVEHLMIDTPYLKGMLERELPKCPTFFSLKNLTLGGFCIICAFDAVSSFLDRCLKLEKLTLLQPCNLVSRYYCQVGGNHSAKASDENLEQNKKGFPCKELQTVEIKYKKSHLNWDRTLHELYELILQRTREIEGVQIILTERIDEEDDQH